MSIETLLSQSLQKLLQGVPGHLRESIEYSLLGPGKRIRPRLVQASAALFALPQPATDAAAAAIEMIHCYTLIHDDLPCMDNDDFRRGKPTNHKVFGEATALLAGDSLMALAVDSLLQIRLNDETTSDAATLLPAENLLKAIERLSWAMGARGVIGGQAAESSLTAQSTLSDLERMHEGKTGALFIASLLMPADLAGLTQPRNAREPQSIQEVTCLTQLGQVLGSAFQVADDLEDAEQDRDSSGNYSPLSILRHLSAQEAQSRSIEALERSKRQMQALWGDRSRELQSVADAVIQKLRDAL